MPGAHPPQDVWVAVGVEVRAERAQDDYEIATIVGVDRDTKNVALHWRSGGMGVVPWAKVWLPDPPLPVLPQSVNPLLIDPVALSRTERAKRLTRQQYSLRGRVRKNTVGAGKIIDNLALPREVQDRVKQLSASAAPPYLLRPRRIVRCPCGWNRIVTPMMIMCPECRCWSHCVCVGLRTPEDAPDRTLQCVFCEYACGRPTQILPYPPTLKGEGYQVPLQLIQQRFHPAVVPTQRQQFHQMQAAVKARLAANGYTIDVVKGGRHGGLDCDDVVNECVHVCSDAVDEGYFDHRYPGNAFRAMRRDACSRVTIIRQSRNGKAVAVLASSGNDCPLFLRAACINLQRALQDPRASLYFDLSDVDSLRTVAAVEHYHTLVHLTLVATKTQHRQRGLGSMLMLYDLAGWAGEGRTQMYLNMTLLRKTVYVRKSEPKKDMAKKFVFFYSAPSRQMYERFGFRLVYPRKPMSAPHPLVPDETAMRCRWMDSEVNDGVLMANLDFWGGVYLMYSAKFVERPGAVLCPPEGDRPKAPIPVLEGACPALEAAVDAEDYLDPVEDTVDSEPEECEEDEEDEESEEDEEEESAATWECLPADTRIDPSAVWQVQVPPPPAPGPSNPTKRKRA